MNFNGCRTSAGVFEPDSPGFKAWESRPNSAPPGIRFHQSGNFAIHRRVTSVGSIDVNHCC